MWRSHLDMIGRNEPIQRKAKFWQSYVRALKGTDDMRAPETYKRPHGIFRPLLTSEFPELATWPHSKSIYDEPIHPQDRINTPGYRYNPVSRETYGVSPRNLYPHHFSSTDRYRPAWYRNELEPEDKVGKVGEFVKEHPESYKPHFAIAKPIYPSYRPWNYTPRPVQRPDPRYRTPPPRPWSPRPEAPTETVAFNFQGQPIYTRGGLTRRPLSELFEPSTSIPWASIVRDPWWWEYPELRPYQAPFSSVSNTPLPFYLRDSYLSPLSDWGHNSPEAVKCTPTSGSGRFSGKRRISVGSNVVIVSAAGQALPLTFIFPRVRFNEARMMKDDDANVQGICNCSIDKPAFMILGNYESHLSVETLDMCKDNGGVMLVLPSYTSNKLQTLDVCVFGPSKSFTSQSIHTWILDHPGKTMSIYDLPEIYVAAWDKVATPINIMT